MVTGVETAGLVLAAIPLLLQLLDVYKDGMKRTAVFFKRKKHVEKLFKALLTQRVLLTENVQTLLLRVEVDDIPEEPVELFELLNGNNEVRERIEHFLGKEAYTSYIDVVSSSERVVRRLITGFKAFNPILSTSKDDILSLIEASNATPTHQLALKERAKLTLDYHDLERSINDLDHSIIMLERIHQAVSHRHQVSVDSTDWKAAKLASSLHIAREHAISLFNALAHSWNAGCHQNHEAKIYLDGTKIVNNQQNSKQTYFKKQKPHNFKLTLSSKDTNLTEFWHESTIEVLDDNNISHNPPMPAAAALGSNRPRVNIATPAPISPSGTISFIDVHNLCTTIDWATRERKILKFYLAPQQRIRCQHKDCANLLKPKHYKSVSLEDLLVPLPQAGIPAKIGLRNRMMLALNLASTLLELHGTPWLTNSWSKKAIKFLKRPVPQLSQLTATANTVLSVVIDYQHPLISKHFQSGRQTSSNAPPLSPKEALLELGIMLLELWHETTLETFYTTTTMGQSGTPMPTDYWGRFTLASMWLDDPHDQPLPLYYTAISQCVKCFFGGAFSTPSWNDANFRKALCKDLIEPLFQSCKQWM